MSELKADNFVYGILETEDTDKKIRGIKLIMGCNDKKIAVWITELEVALSFKKMVDDFIRLKSYEEPTPLDFLRRRNEEQRRWKER